MRQILFRGKRIDNGEWVYGCLERYSEEMSYITVDLIENEVHQVHTETVGQYIGREDNNGVKMYEGDKVSVWVDKNEAYGRLKFESAGKRMFGVVTYNHTQCGYEISFPDNDYNLVSIEIGWGGEEFEVIGNIHQEGEHVAS